jgi:hypothetical protein
MLNKEGDVCMLNVTEDVLHILHSERLCVMNMELKHLNSRRKVSQIIMKI